LYLDKNELCIIKMVLKRGGVKGIPPGENLDTALWGYNNDEITRILLLK
jgi:hypothetical protein